MSEVTYFKFHSSLPSCRFVFKDGTLAHFNAYQYLTTSEVEAEELTAEVKRGHPHIYIKSGEERMTAEQMDPMSKLKKKIIEEFLASQQAAVNPDNDMGNSVQTPGAGLATTKTLASIQMPSKSK